MDTKIADLATLTPVDNTDWTVVVDVSDTTDGPNGPTKKAARSEFKGDTGATGATGATGSTGAAGADGANAFVYIAYASDSSGTGFTTTFNAALDYIAILSTDTEIASPAVGDFAGPWKNYKGATGATGAQGPQGNPGTGSGDMVAATYDPNSIAADAFAMDNMVEGSTAKILTSAERTKLSNTSGTNTGDQSSVTGNAGTATALQTARTIDGQSFDGTANITVIAPGTHAATGKTTPVDADELALVDSAASNVLKKLTWANLKATLKTYFDTLYQPLDSDLTTWAGKTAPSGTVVGTSDTQTLTGKTLTSPNIASPTVTTEWDFGAHSVGFTETDNGNSSTADTIDWRISNKQKSTLTGNCTFTFTAPTKPCSLILKLVQDGTGSRTVTWPSTVHWSGGTAPTLTTTASKVDIVCFYYDGATYFGTSSLNFTA